MSAGWAASPSELLMKAATRASAGGAAQYARRLTLIVGLAMLFTRDSRDHARADPGQPVTEHHRRAEPARPPR